MAAQQTVVIVVDDNAGFLKGVARLLAREAVTSVLKVPFDRASATSGLPRQTDILGVDRHVSKVPAADLGVPGPSMVFLSRRRSTGRWRSY
jgi:hypothetical protein